MPRSKMRRWCRFAAAIESTGDQPYDTGVGAQRFGDQVGARGAQPVLEQAIRQQVRRDGHPVRTPAAQRGYRIGHPGFTGGGEG